MKKIAALALSALMLAAPASAMAMSITYNGHTYLEGHGPVPINCAATTGGSLVIGNFDAGESASAGGIYISGYTNVSSQVSPLNAASNGYTNGPHAGLWQSGDSIGTDTQFCSGSLWGRSGLTPSGGQLWAFNTIDSSANELTEPCLGGYEAYNDCVNDSGTLISSRFIQVSYTPPAPPPFTPSFHQLMAPASSSNMVADVSTAVGQNLVPVSVPLAVGVSVPLLFLVGRAIVALFF